MKTHPNTLSQYLCLCEQQRPEMGGIAGLIDDVAVACKRIAHECSRGALAGVCGYASSQNVQGETQKKIDILANDLFIQSHRWGGNICALVSEELDLPWLPPKEATKGPFILYCDPLDGSSNSDVNVAVGSIFSVQKAPLEALDEEFNDQWAMNTGRHQVAAGYTIYGPATMMVLTVGNGTHAFTLDRDIGEFIHTHEDIKIPPTTREFAINTSNSRFWEPPVKRYVEECKAGLGGPRNRDFNMRWIASLVAEAHRILMRGGVFLYPRDNKDPHKAGRLRLLYEANPISMVVEQAGGLASTGRERILDVVPSDWHQRIPLIFGSYEEVEYLEQLHRDLPARDYDSPLFHSRGLFTDTTSFKK